MTNVAKKQLFRVLKILKFKTAPEVRVSKNSAKLTLAPPLLLVFWLGVELRTVSKQPAAWRFSSFKIHKMTTTLTIFEIIQQWSDHGKVQLWPIEKKIMTLCFAEKRAPKVVYTQFVSLGGYQNSGGCESLILRSPRWRARNPQDSLTPFNKTSWPSGTFLLEKLFYFQPWGFLNPSPPY